LRASGVCVRTAGRGAGVDAHIATLSAQTDWRAALEGVDCVIHLAGPAHARFDETVLRAAITDASAALAVQAAAPRENARERAEALRTHNDFNLRNPNRVRALAAAFAMRNPRAFHAADGGGYRFLVGLARDIDPLNPALAARLLTPFESWRRFDEQRQTHAKAELTNLNAAAQLSKNTREMLDRTLA